MLDSVECIVSWVCFTIELTANRLRRSSAANPSAMLSGRPRPALCRESPMLRFGRPRCGLHCATFQTRPVWARLCLRRVLTRLASPDGGPSAHLRHRCLKFSDALMIRPEIAEVVALATVGIANAIERVFRNSLMPRAVSPKFAVRQRIALNLMAERNNLAAQGLRFLGSSDNLPSPRLCYQNYLIRRDRPWHRLWLFGHHVPGCSICWQLRPQGTCGYPVWGSPIQDRK
jgi:hypothetical protein